MVRAAFDDPALVSYAGLVPVMRLAESCDLHGIVCEWLRVPTDKGANASDKVATIVAGMLTGADSIDDLDVVRHGGMAQLFDGVYAPSTLASFLRTFSHGAASERPAEWMLLWMSKGTEDLEVGDQRGVDVADDVALQASNDLFLAQSLLGASVDIGLRSELVAHATEHDRVEGAVGGSVAAAVESVAVLAAGAGRDWGDTA